MKHALLFLFSFPILLYSQAADVRIKETAPVPGLKSVKTTTLFKVTKKGAVEWDTAFKEVKQYNERGFVSLKTYASVLDKSTYTARTEYYYAPEMTWKKLRFENDRLQDSTIVENEGATASRYIYSATGLHEWYRYRGDSAFCTIVDTKDTIRRVYSLAKVERDSQWDYVYAEKFARKEIISANNIDSVRYYDQKDKCIFMIVNHFDNSHHNVRSEYYNYGVDKFAVLSMPYNDRLAMIEYVVKSKAGKPSCTIDREYDEKGLLKKETYQWHGKGRQAIIKNYAYEFYK